MARADLLLNLVRAGSKGDIVSFKKIIEAIVAEERSKQHHILADRLASYLTQNGNGSTSSFFNNSNKSTQSADLYFEIEPHRNLQELILPAAVSNACNELIEEQNRSDLLRAHNIEPRNRLLLVGPPGNGKTSLAEAIASELAVSLFVVRYESVIASYLGETAVRLSKLFEQVRSRRCVLFFDEFDVVGKERGDVHETGEIKRVVSSLLMQVDALPSYVVVVTATNHPELLDRAVWRRFQLRLMLPPPTKSQVEEWLLKFEKRFGVEIGHPISAHANKLIGLSFSELEQFSFDVQRRYLLSTPNNDIRKVVNSCLEQWSKRYVITQDRKADLNA